MAAIWVGNRGNDDVGKPVTIDVAGRSHGTAAEVSSGFAADLKSIQSIQARQIDIRGKTGTLAKDDICCA